MYDGRPASRAARGTPTVAASTPVIRGSCQLAMVSPLRGQHAPCTLNISWMRRGTSSETGRRIPYHCLSCARVTHSPAHPERGLGLVHHVIRRAALMLACFALGAARPVPAQRIIA